MIIINEHKNESLVEKHIDFKVSHGNVTDFTDCISPTNTEEGVLK